MKTPAFLHIIVCVFVLLPSAAQGSDVHRYHARTGLIGRVQTYQIKADESLIEIARSFGIGYNEIMDANPGLDPFVPGSGTNIIIPTAWIIPAVRSGDVVVINLSEMRLYYLFTRSGSRRVATFPIGIGEEGYNTPLGNFTVIQKILHPSWYVPRSIRNEQPELPAIVPPGPENPLGSHALRLSLRTVLIHGTNRPFAIGRKASHGCIRLYPEDIPTLFQMVPVGAKVIIVRQPVKVGVKEGTVYMEVHRDDRFTSRDYAGKARSILKKKGLLKSVSRKRMEAALLLKQGIPLAISEEK